MSTDIHIHILAETALFLTHSEVSVCVFVCVFVFVGVSVCMHFCVCWECVGLLNLVCIGL